MSRAVFLHALPLSGAMWERQIGALPGSVAPTLYGYGDSVAAWASGVLRDVDGDGLVAVGSSVGGFVALEMARQAPDRVAAVVLVGSKAGIRRDDAERDREVELLEAGGFDAGWGELWAPLFGPGTDVEAARRIGAANPLSDVIRGVRAFFDRDDLTETARTMPAALHGISGALDRHPLASTTRAIVEEVGTGVFEAVPDCGHYVSLEAPDAFEAFLRRAISSPSL